MNLTLTITIWVFWIFLSKILPWQFRQGEGCTLLLLSSNSNFRMHRMTACLKKKNYGGVLDFTFPGTVPHKVRLQAFCFNDSPLTLAGWLACLFTRNCWYVISVFHSSLHFIRLLFYQLAFAQWWSGLFEKLAIGSFLLVALHFYSAWCRWPVSYQVHEQAQRHR